MSDVPAFARLPNGPHEPNVTPRGVMVVPDSHKLAKTLMKMGKPKGPAPKGHGQGTRRMPNHTRVPRSRDVKWY